MKKVAVVLSGCGVYDGSEIQEAVLTLLYLDMLDVEYSCFAPDIPQAQVINHITGEVCAADNRNVLVEAARIARGRIDNLNNLHADNFDALIIPGGFGAAKNLCNFAFAGANCSVHPEIDRVMRAFHSQQKPIGTICIAPVMGAKVLGASVTIGNDAGVADAICQMGGSHQEKSVTDIAIDEEHNLISVPAYMYDARISQVAEGIKALVCEVVSRA